MARRITEDGVLRTTESGVVRVTEDHVDIVLPDAVDFGNVLDAIADTEYESELVTLTGFTGTLTLSLPAGGEMSVDGGAYTDADTEVEPDQTLQLKTTALPGAGSAQNLAVYVNGLPWGAWLVMTEGTEFIKGCRRRRERIWRAIKVLFPVNTTPTTDVDVKA